MEIIMLAVLVPILILIAGLVIPNYLRDEPLRPGTRLRIDQRTLTIALETYYLAHNSYPAWSLDHTKNAFGGIEDKKGLINKLPNFTMQNGSQLATLTTPNAYISSLFSDPFAPIKGMPFCYWTPAPDSAPPVTGAVDTTATHGIGYILWSPGPDGVYDLTIDNIAQAYTPHIAVPTEYLVERTYDPSNGSRSRGDVYRYKQ